ncbi:hypothetical protein ASPCAL10832 [Aspergillus calidoustus]|uniref:Uncharacterized protein n=1 Tax=Aspergillus calidoustus TaxID=454130 RepID=A0A0U5CD63_ASPCI|nr:hypothetical protein ASPCAL10832 [Aspergillus calidoustus]
MAEALGVAGIAYPIAKDLVTLAQKMKRAYKKMRHAKADVKEIMKRTETVALTYNFYQDTMDEAKQIPELEPMFKKHRKLMRRITTESKRLIDTLEDFVQFFWFDLHDSPVELIERWISRLDWYRQSRRVIPPLFHQLGVFEGSMRTVAALIGVQMARQTYLKAPSNLSLAQLQSFMAMLRIDFDKLQKAQRAQQQFFEQQKTASHKPNSDRNHFGEKVIRSLKKEISRVPNNRPPDSPSSMDSTPPLSSPTPDHLSRLTPPSSPPSQGSGDAIFPTEVVDLAEDEEAPSEQKTSSGPVSAPHPWQRASSHPSSPKPPTPPSPPCGSGTGSEDESYSNKKDYNEAEEQPLEGSYMALPPFGPPRLCPRPKPARASTDYLNPPGSVEDRTDTISSHIAGHSWDKNIGSDSRLRRRNGSTISVYGNEGEVTPTHKTGSAGLPPGGVREITRRRRD